jgi:hypothetical protein
MSISRQHIVFIIVAILTFLEIGCLTAWRKSNDPHTLPFIYLAVQLAVGILPLIFCRKTDTPQYLSLNFDKKWQMLLAIFGIWGGYKCYDVLTIQYSEIALNPAYSDIIPQIQQFCKQAANWKYPYTPFDDFGYRMTPTYLPAQWMPYMPAHWFKFDPRFVTLTIFLGTYAYSAWLAIKKSSNVVFAFILMAIPVTQVILIDEHDQGVWSVTVEMLIMCFYWLMGIGIVEKKYTLVAIATILCLMSRFALVFWLPLFLFILWFQNGQIFTKRFVFSIIGGCLLLYAPFLAIDYKIFFNAQTYYDAATVGEWTRDGKPVHLYNGLGFALYFLERGGDVVHNIALTKKIMLGVSALLSVGLGILWWRVKDKIDSDLYAVCALKLSLALFYAFIQIPYSYLYVTPFIISSVVLLKLSRNSAIHN